MINQPLLKGLGEPPSSGSSFAQFHRENPHVYKLFCEYAQRVIAAGRARFSAYAIFNRLRWHYAFESTDRTFKLNNNLQPHYARLWIRDHPKYPGFFTLRRMN